MAAQSGRAVSPSESCPRCRKPGVSDPAECTSDRCSFVNKRLAAVKELTAASFSAKEIAAKLGVSIRQVGRMRSQLGIAKGVYHPPVDPAKIQTALLLLEDGSGYREAARTIGVEVRTLTRRFPGMGLTRSEAAAIRHANNKYGHVLQ